MEEAVTCLQGKAPAQYEIIQTTTKKYLDAAVIPAEAICEK